MNSSEKDYNKLYQLQDKFLSWWLTLDLPFYLTGGTALGRFYLNHRLSEDLDFFINADNRYQQYMAIIKNKMAGKFNVDIQQSLFTEDYSRFFINEGDTTLKIEFVNDVEYYPGTPLFYRFGRIDTPENILTNKLTAIVGRDEPKDVFDIVHIALNYSFNWNEMFIHAKEKTIINEIDVEERLFTFPIEWLENVNWFLTSIDIEFFKKTLRKISDDFLLGQPNSLGKLHPPISKAKPF